MDNTNPYAHQKNWAGIAELAQAAGVSTRTLRYYESCGLIAPARAENGYRIYAPSEVKRPCADSFHEALRTSFSHHQTVGVK